MLIILILLRCACILIPMRVLPGAQTLRYLALLPDTVLEDGRRDWGTRKFVFDVEVCIVYVPHSQHVF